MFPACSPQLAITSSLLWSDCPAGRAPLELSLHLNPVSRHFLLTHHLLETMDETQETRLLDEKPVAYPFPLRCTDTLTKNIQSIDNSSSSSQHSALLGTVTHIKSPKHFLAALQKERRWEFPDVLDRLNEMRSELARFLDNFDLCATDHYFLTGEPMHMALFRTLFANQLPEPDLMRAFVRVMMENVRKTPSENILPPEAGDNDPDFGIMGKLHLRLRGWPRNSSLIGSPRAPRWLHPLIPSRWVKDAPSMDAEALAQADESELARMALYFCDMALSILDYPLYSINSGRKLYCCMRGTVPVRQRLFQCQGVYALVDAISSTMSIVLEDKVVFMTNNGLIGLGPACVNEGDQVWNLPGRQTPLLLKSSHRPNLEKIGGDSSTIGECYIHGITNRET